MAKGLKVLKNLKEKFNPGSAMMSMAGALLPQLGAHLSSMEKPEEDGGMLKADETVIAYMITQRDGDVRISTVTIGEEEGKMVLKRNLTTMPLMDYINKPSQATDEQ